MGYFSNGCEGMDYEERYCDRCLHNNEESFEGCPVWMLHQTHNFKEANNKASFLHRLIPIDKEGRNLQCLMFLESQNETN